jgi:excisionase family DNA binding protein
MVTTAEAARRLGIAPRTVRTFADRGDLPSIRLTPRSPRKFRAEDIEQLLERAEAGAA